MCIYIYIYVYYIHVCIYIYIYIVGPFTCEILVIASLLLTLAGTPLPSHKGFLYYSSPTKDSLLLLSRRTSSLSQSDKGFFIFPLSKDFFTIPVRQRILYLSSLKGLLFYPSPTMDSLFFLSQKISKYMCIMYDIISHSI